MKQYDSFKKQCSAKGFMLQWLLLPFYLFTFLLFPSCTADPMYGSPYACSFIFYTSYHPTSALTQALGNPSSYVTVSPQVRQGVMHLIMTTNGGENEDLTLTTEKEAKRLDYSNMGANRRLIIGCSNASGLKAYDGHCSNCLREFGGLNYPLAWIENGRKLKCAKCARVYNPDADGLVVENGQEGDRNLYQYAIVLNSEFLHVYNGKPQGF